MSRNADNVSKVFTKTVSKESKLYQQLPWLFKGVEAPRIQYGYSSPESKNYFLKVLDGQSPIRTINYNRTGSVYNAELTGPQEHLNCVFDSEKPLWNLSQSALKFSAGVKGTPTDSVDFLLNLNNSALRAEGRMLRARLSGLESYIPSSGRFSLQSGVEGTPIGRTDVGLNYHGSDLNLELQNSHITKACQKVKSKFTGG